MLQTRQTDIYGCGGTHKHTACCDFSKENKMRSPALDPRPNIRTAYLKTDIKSKKKLKQKNLKKL